MSDAFLNAGHSRELEASAIDAAIIAERGYETIGRPGASDNRPRERLRHLGFPTWAIGEDADFPGMLIPAYGPTGQRASYQWKPRRPVRNRDGKPIKYASPRGQASRLDVHPRNVGAMPDPTIPLWITEGVKKADALTSRGLCVVALSGVYNWRSSHGTLGDWEDVALKGREVVICFDSDARTNPNVARAMGRLGKWLRSKGVKRVRYLVVPGEVGGKPVKGVDDFLTAGGTLEGLTAATTTTPPDPDIAEDTFTDARLAETVADDVLADRFIWVGGLGWLAWDGRRWTICTEVSVTEATRLYTLDRFGQVLATIRAGGQAAESLKGWTSMLSAGRSRSVLSLARGIVEHRADELDRDLDLLNTPAGVVNLATGVVGPHDPALMMTKLTSGCYRPGYRHPDWESALEALPKPERDWLRVRAGQAITGHPTPDGIAVVMQGAGENGKTLITTDGTVPALGDYASMASAKLFAATRGTEHSTERADLRGRRLLVAEELTEGRAIDITALKQILDVGTIKARYVHRDNFEFVASHSMFITTNYIPVVTEVDHGTWRRLALLQFPYTFKKPGEPLQAGSDRRGDPGLKARIRAGADGQHDAIVTWAVAGAMAWYAEPDTAMAVTEMVAADTRTWRTEADRILGFWDECIVADRDACVLTTELRDEFNEWLTTNGHRPWSKETFAPRFLQHSETRRHGVEEVQRREVHGLSRRPMNALANAPGRPRVYLGVRFRQASDLQESGSVTTVTGVWETVPYTRSSESLQKGRDGRDARSSSPPSDPSEQDHPGPPDGHTPNGSPLLSVAADCLGCDWPVASQGHAVNCGQLKVDARGQRWLCVVCSSRLDPVLVAEGAYTHPACDLPSPERTP